MSLELNNKLYASFKSLQEQVMALGDIQKETTNTFIRSLMSELKEAYDRIDLLEATIELRADKQSDVCKQLQ